MTTTLSTWTNEQVRNAATYGVCPRGEPRHVIIMEEEGVVYWALTCPHNCEEEPKDAH